MFRQLITALALLAFVASQLVAISAHGHCAAMLSGHGPEARPHIHWGSSGHSHDHPHDHHHAGAHPRGEHEHSDGCHPHSPHPSADGRSGAWSPRCSLCAPHDEDVVYLVSDVSAAVRCGTDRSASSAPEKLATAAVVAEELPVVGGHAERAGAVPWVDPSGGKLFLKLRNLRI